MTAADDVTRELSELIARQYAAAQSLLAALEQERAALAAPDVEAIDAAGTAKLAHLRDIEALETERALLAGMPGIESEALDATDSRGALAADWQRLLELLGRCRRLNESNGALVALKRRQVQQALALLCGAGSVTTYGSDGSILGPGRATTSATA